MVPLILPVFLLAAQVFALLATYRHRLWRAVPLWTLYLGVATIHMITGLLIALRPGSDYPVALLYFEPVLILCQIGLTFESCLNILHISPKGGSPENRLILWLIPLVPAAIALPIEIGFVRDALEKWNKNQGDALMLMYAVRRFLSITLVAVLCVIPLIAGLSKRKGYRPAMYHHFVLIGYFLCSALGYLAKSYVDADRNLTILFFVVGPLMCFIAWTWEMWNRTPGEMEAIEEVTPDEGTRGYDQRGVAHHS